jgi:hypothetical protein
MVVTGLWIFLGICQPGTSVHKVRCELHPHMTLRRLLPHLGCVYNRSM